MCVGVVALIIKCLACCVSRSITASVGVYCYPHYITPRNNSINIDFTTYSSSEQVVGTWTDGKTIYRKVVDSGVITGSTNITYDAITGAEELISISGYWLNGSNNQQCSFNGTFVTGGPIAQATRAVLYGNDHTIKLNFTQISGTVPSTVRFVVAIEYTKHT